MSLSPGTRLGPYEIVAPLGAGGMGEVYRAKDTKFNRDVRGRNCPSRFATGRRGLRTNARSTSSSSLSMAARSPT